MDEQRSFSYIGKSIPKLDAHDKVTGKALYLHDVNLPGMLHAAVLYSAHPHARIRNIDVSRAASLAGVKAVLTGQDIKPRYFGYSKDNTALKGDRVRCMRDEVAAVAAVDEDTAREALDLIRVEYEELDGIFDPEEALKPGAPLLYPEKGTNLVMEYSYSHGDVEAGRKASDVLVEETYHLPRVAHCCMETSGCIAQVDALGALTLYSTTQIPYLLIRDMSDATGIKPSRIRILQTVIGGGFGAKLDMYPFEPIAALLSQKSGRPVRLVFSRSEEFIASPTRQEVKLKLQCGAARDGTFTFRQTSLMCDNGAHVSWGSVVPVVMAHTFACLYPVPHASFDCKVVYTNNVYAGAMRGFGNPQMTFAMESAIDVMAERLGLDRLEIRLKNANKPGQILSQGSRITTCGLSECIRKAAEDIEWSKPRPKNRGVGIASTINVGGGARIYRSDGCGTTIKIDDFGRVVVATGASEIGQGSETVIAQIVAEELGIDIADITVNNHDTDAGLWDVGCHASRTTFVAGRSAQEAARSLKEQIAEVAAKKLKVAPDRLRFKDGKCFPAGDPAQGIEIARLARSAHFRPDGSVLAGHAFYDPPNEMLDKGLKGNISATYGFGAQAAEVEVDPETGKVTVLRVTAAKDVGRAINPMFVEGQIQGGVAQGLGYALGEELIYDKGKLMNMSFLDYRLPTAQDVPKITARIVETMDPEGPFGAKGVGEMGITPTAPAIVNAIAHATGARVTSLPANPERVLEALRKTARKETKEL